MAEDIKSLIEKIQQDGIAVAEEKARAIEEKALSQAADIIVQAKQGAENLLAKAKDSIVQMEEKQKALLSQAGRDMLLLLRREINAMLDTLIREKVKDTLTPEVLGKVLGVLIEAHKNGAEDSVLISLKNEDRVALEVGFLNKLKEEIKRGIVLRPADDLRAGFTISFDAGKSAFDFSDTALSEYIGAYVKPKLAELLKSKTGK